MTPQRNAGQITRCPYCHRHVKAASLLRHRKRSVRCRAYQVFDWLERHGYERLKVENCLWHRFVVAPPLTPKPFLEEVPYPHYWPRPTIPAPAGGWTVGVRMPREFWDVAALEPPGRGPDHLPRLFWGPTYVNSKLQARYGVWVHESFREPFVRALEHALAEKIVQVGGAIAYKNAAKRELRHHPGWVTYFGWFAYRMGQILEQALGGGDLQAFVDRYQTGIPLSEVPDQRNDGRIACPHCGKKVLPRQLARHQTLSFCRRAAYGKAGMQLVWRLYPWRLSGVAGTSSPAHAASEWATVWQHLKDGARSLGLYVGFVTEFERGDSRARYVEMWAPPDQATILQGLLDAAVEQVQAQGRMTGVSSVPRSSGGLHVFLPDGTSRYIPADELVHAAPVFARADLDLAVGYVFRTAALTS